MFNLYILKDWYGDIHIMTSSKIHKRVMSDSSKSNYSWIAPATELVNVCDKKSFPKKYSIDIKVSILNCYSEELLVEGDYLTEKLETDLDYVYSAYNSLYGIDKKEVIEARTNFLKSFLLSIVYTSEVGLFHRGQLYDKVCNDWINEKFNKLFIKEKLDFNYLYSVLDSDFTRTVEQLEMDNVFLEEDKKEQKIIQGYIEDCAKKFKPIVLNKILK